MCLSFLRWCCRPCYHRQYNTNRKSLRERFFGSDSTKDQRTIYATNDQYFSTTPSSLYTMNKNNHFYSSGRSYDTTGAIETDNVFFLPNELHPNIIVSDKIMNDDSIEPIERNVRKNYIINEIENYYIQQNPSYDEYHMKHNQEIQTLPGPTITIINMAAERITDDPNWEEANSFEIQYDLSSPSTNNRSLQLNQATAKYITNDPSLLQKNVKFQEKPNIYIHQDNNQYSFNLNKKVINPKLGSNFHQISDNDDNSSTISRLSEDDYASIYETTRVFTPKRQSPTLLETDDEYKTAGIDEIEIEIKELIRLQKPNNTYNDILSSHFQKEINRLKLHRTEQQLEDNAFLY